MKKLFLRGGVFSILLSVTLVACKKESMPESNSPIQVSAVQGLSSDKKMLIFNSSSDYENLLSDTSQIAQKELISEISKMEMTSYAEKLQIEKSTKDLIQDKFFSQILNEDLAVQIGDYIYKINPETEKVFVLPVVNKSEYKDLVNENKANKHIRQFSTSDYVIQLAESGDAGEKSLFCGEDGAGSRTVYCRTTFIDCPVAGGTIANQFNGYVTYDRYGIYFTLKSEANCIKTGVRIYINLENAWDKVKCGSTHGATSYPWFQNNSTYSTNQVFRKYYGVQPLNGYHLKARIRCEVPGYPDASLYTTYFTDWAEIRVNSPY